MRYEVVIVIESVYESSKDYKEIRENATVQCIYTISCPYASHKYPINLRNVILSLPGHCRASFNILGRVLNYS